MHLIESYATNCGLQIDEPSIMEKYFPLSFDKYIILDAGTEQSKDYDYWHDVFDIILPKLKEEGIEVLQLGNAGSKQIQRAQIGVGMTSRNQEAYLMKHSMMYVGVDGYLSQLAGTYNKKSVCLYSNNHAKEIMPYWGKDKNRTLLESDRKGNKPSFSNAENPKTINYINPELIARSILESLDLNYDFNYKSVEFGINYANKLVETLPDQVVNTGGMGIESIVVRMDFLFNEQNLMQQLAICPCSVVTDKPIAKEIIKKYKPRIKEVIYNITEDHEPSFVAELPRNGIKFVLFSELEQKEIDKIKIHYMDFEMIHKKQAADTDHLKSMDNLFYRSSKLTLSNGKMYPSRAAPLRDKPIKDQHEISEVIDDTEFWKEHEYFYFMQKSS